MDHVFNQLDDKDFLRNMGGITIDRSTRREGLTMAGLMMFGKGLPVRDRFDNIRMDYIDKTNLMGDSRWSDRLTYDGTWENNLFNFFTRVMPKLTADLKRPFKLEGMERIDDTPVHKAVREAMTNMIIHADLFITGVLKVEKYDNEFLFSNPGSLKLPIEDIMNGGNSKARNPRIQNMLRMIGFGDNIGSGYPTILKAWKDEHWRKPILLDRTELRQVDLTMPMTSLLPETALNEMKAYYGEEAYRAFTSEEQMILAYVWNGDSISNTELQQLLGLNSIEVGKILHQMVDKQLLNKENKNRWTTYTLRKEDAFDATGEEKSEEKTDVTDNVTNNEEGGQKTAKSSGTQAKSSGTQAKSSGTQAKSSGTRRKTTEKVLEYIKNNPQITAPQIAMELGLSTRGVEKSLRQLRDLGIIKRVGSPTFGGYWEIL
ncbi:MAG: winged helix-turn-helix transcriptional regulator [Prevotellaceae bacterium]|nr:winged helix-turn-helix transcriptional regulator [Prevotellaceae bacterium]